MLQIRDVVSGYGETRVLHDICMQIAPREIVSLIGANGVGKTTLLRTIMGALPCRRGSITFNGREISQLRPDRIVQMGLAMVPEGRQIFAPLTVYENLLLGSYCKYRELGRSGREELLCSVFELFPILKERRKQAAGTLSGGEQQMLAIGRALMVKPQMLLLDEPSLGLGPAVIENIYEAFHKLNAIGLTILVVEQNTRIALTFAQRCYVMDGGAISLEGPACDLLHHDRVKEVYLGQTKLEG